MTAPASHAFTSSTDFCSSWISEPTRLAEKIAVDAVSVTAPVAALA
jgi:hypothetical protein